ncbi:hypothetical protein [Brevibacillus fortis]|uniref:hypothetical protein n=1 Tax=Brevibacillus fortis TaxID=2126352 RepID=UPI0038FC23D1
MSKTDFEKTKKRFQKFFEDEDNQREVFNTVLNVASETLPDVNVTNPGALLNVANDPQVEPGTRGDALLILFLFLLALFLPDLFDEDAE